MLPVEESMELVLQIQRELNAGRGINVRWPSAERLTSSNLRKSKRKGPGLEFAGQKVYNPADGDDPRRIDYNASAAEAEDEMGDSDLIVQTFKSPRIVRVNVLLDVNKSMNMGTKGSLKSVLSAKLAGCGIKAAKKNNDQAAFVSYTHKPVTILKAQNAGRIMTSALTHAIMDRDFAEAGEALGEAAISEMQSEGGGLAASLKTIPYKMRNVLLVVTDFVNMDEDDWDALRMAGMQHDTVAVFVQDKRERELPKVPFPGQHFKLEDFRGETRSFWVAPDNSPRWYLNQMRRLFGSVTTREEYANNWRVHEENILANLQECGVVPLIVSTDEPDEAVRSLLGLLANKLRS